MLANLEALYAVDALKSITRAARELGVSQPAITRRIDSLEQEVGKRLIEPAGRGIRLTLHGSELVARTRPVFEALVRELSFSPTKTRPVSAVISDSLLLSWGEGALRAVSEKHKIRPAVHCVHASRVLQTLHEGYGDIALVYGEYENSDLSGSRIGFEEFVIVPSGAKRPRGNRLLSEMEVISIHRDLETARHLEQAVKEWTATSGKQIRVRETVHTFIAAASLARIGLGNALIPKGLARALRIKELIVPRPAIRIPISALTLRGHLRRTEVLQLIEALRSVQGGRKGGKARAV